MVGKRVAILHYSAPPVVGGVETVMREHVRVLAEAGYGVTVFAGRGETSALSPYAELFLLDAMDSKNPLVDLMNTSLERGSIPDEFEGLVSQLYDDLSPLLGDFDHVIVHNVFTKHFNLALTVALYRILEDGVLPNCIAWCHDFTWTSPSSGNKVFPRYPWDLLRTFRSDVTYVVVSEGRRRELAGLFGCPAETIHVVYNGVNPDQLLGLSPEGSQLVRRLELFEADLVILMPVRVTQAKNIEYALQTVSRLIDNQIRAKLVVTGPPDPHDSQSMYYFHSLTALRHELALDRDAHFIFESGPDPNNPFYIDSNGIGELYRVSDLMLMPSHREGYGMPVLEAGLAGIPAFCTGVPAAKEIGKGDIIPIKPGESPQDLAKSIRTWMENDGTYRFRKRVRQGFTWEALLKRDIEPLLEGRSKQG